MCRYLALRVLVTYLIVGFIPQMTVAQSDPFLSILESELDREFNVLSKAEIPVYYMDYQIRDDITYTIFSASGSLMSSDSNHQRIGRVSVRTGSQEYDNSHSENDFQSHNRSPFGYLQLPVENNDEAIRYLLWKYTDAAYEMSSKQFESLSNAPRDSTDLPDFSTEQSVQFEEPVDVSPENFKIKEWESKLKRLSGLFNSEKDILSGTVTLNYSLERKYFVNSEGSVIVENAPYAMIFVSATIRAEDNAVIPLNTSYFAFSPEELPEEKEIAKDILKTIEMLQELRTAPVATPYTGPAILHPRVAGVFFHEIFGHRIEGHRLRSEWDGQTFKEQIEKKVLPETFSIYSDPGLKTYNGTALIGNYRYDDEGVAGQRVEVVSKGILKEFLMSRKPLENFEHSNGHGRAAAGNTPVARQSNLIIQGGNSASSEDLRKLLIAECKKQGKEFGYYFVDVTGGFTQTDRYNPNAFNIMPTVVYRVYTDGRPDELVRGVNLIGTPLSMFAEIMTSGSSVDTFTGFCGAESGNVPVSASAPEILVRRIETQKKPLSNSGEATILSNPSKIEKP